MTFMKALFAGLLLVLPPAMAAEITPNEMVDILANVLPSAKP